MSHLNSQMASNSDFDSSKPELSVLKSHRNCSFFCIPSLFEGMSNKCSSDYESAWSPTSPLDFRVFSNLGNPFGGSSKSNRKGYQKSWDSGKVGLSIVDSLDDHTDSSSRIVLQPPDSKNILFGFTKCRKIHHLPNPISQDHKPNVVSEIAHHLQSSCNHLKKSQESLCEHMESDFEVSEDYTCVILHGPNPRTTRFYGDQVLDSLEHNGSLKKDFSHKKESIFEIVPFTLTTTTPTDVLPSNDFLSFCYYCNKKLDKEKDIYMYRGYKAFCSTECRSEEIHLDEEMEIEEEEEEASSKSGSSSDKDIKENSHGVIFTVG